MFDCLWRCHSFHWLSINPFTMVHQYTFKQSCTGYAMLLMSRIWRICFALGLIPSKIINQSRTVINISVWLSHTTVINVLIVVSAKLLYGLCKRVTVLPIPCALPLLNSINIYPLFRPLIKHILPFPSMREHLSIHFVSNCSVLMWNLSWLYESANQWHITQLLNLSIPVALHLNHSADTIFLSVPPAFCSISSDLNQYLSARYTLIIFNQLNIRVPSFRLYFLNCYVISQIIWNSLDQKWMLRLDALSCLIEL